MYINLDETAVQHRNRKRFAVNRKVFTILKYWLVNTKWPVMYTQRYLLMYTQSGLSMKKSITSIFKHNNGLKDANIQLLTFPS